MTTENAETLRMIADVKGELGEVRGQLRELIHNTNNLRQVMEAHAVQYNRVPALASDVAALQARVLMLEAKEHQRAGAMTLGNFIFKSPLLGWVFGAGVIAYSTIFGK